MFRNILGTAGSKFLVAVLSLLILIVKTNNFGKEGVGTISLIVLAITIILLINSIIGGAALVYLVPRISIFKLMVPSYIWAFFASIIGIFILSTFNLIPSEYTYHIFILSLFQSLMSININILLGKEEIRKYNIISIIQTVSFLLSLILFIYILKRVEVMSYVYSVYIDYFLSFILSLIFVLKYIKVEKLSKLFDVIKQIFKYGSIMQLANITQLLNYRFNFYLIEAFLGRAALGLYSVGTQISEGVLLFGKSAAIVQYSRISNTKDLEYSKKLTLNMIVLTSLITAFIIGFVLLLPNEFFKWIFGKEFNDLRLIFLTLSIGIISLAFSFMFSHYFSGIGKPHHNTISSGIGFLFMLGLGFIFIPKYGLLAAGLVTSITYLVSTIYQLIVFVRMTHTNVNDVAESFKNIKPFIKEIKKHLLQNR